MNNIEINENSSSENLEKETKVSSEDLDYLSNHYNEEVRKIIADHENTSSETLDKLANDNNENVRAIVAGNKNTSAETLDKLSNDESEKVREAAIENFKDENIERKMDSVEVNNFSVETAESLQAAQQQGQQQNVAQEDKQNNEQIVTM